MLAIKGILAVLVVTALAISGCGSGDTSTGDETTEASTAEGTQTEGATTNQSPAGTCSAAGLAITLPEDSGLPGPVAETRQELFDAALACDFERLGGIAAEGGDSFFSYTFGADEDPVAYWRRFDKRERILARLAQILTTPHVTVEDGGTYYAWPPVHREDPTDADWEALAARGAYSDKEIAQFERFGGYLGYRVGIRADGTWSFFIAGD